MARLPLLHRLTVQTVAEMAPAVPTDPALGLALAEIAREVAAKFELLLPASDNAAARLVEAMRYAALGGGKRLRPLLLAATAELFGVERDTAIRAGTAIEAIHV